MRTASPDHPLRNPTYRRYFVGRVISILGGTFVPVALAFAVLELTGSTALLGVLLAAQAVPQLAFVLVGGAFGDMLPRRGILVLTNTVMCATQATTAVLLILEHTPTVALVLLQGLYGIAQAFFAPADTGMASDILRKDQMQQAQALLSISRNAARIAGPVLAGALVVTVGAGMAILMDAASFLVAALCYASLRIVPRPFTPKGGMVDSLREGWREFSARTWVWMMVSVFSFNAAVVWPAIAVIGPSVAFESDLGAVGWSFILSAQGVGALLAGFILLRWQPRRPLVVGNLVVTLQSVFLLALAGPMPIVVVIVAAACGAAGAMTADTLWTSTLQREIPPDRISRVSSYDWLGTLAFMPLGMAAMGFLAEHVPLDALLIGIALANLAIRLMVAASPSIRGVIQQPTRSGVMTSGVQTARRAAPSGTGDSGR